MAAPESLERPLTAHHLRRHIALCTVTTMEPLPALVGGRGLLPSVDHPTASGPASGAVIIMSFPGSVRVEKPTRA